MAEVSRNCTGCIFSFFPAFFVSPLFFGIKFVADLLESGEEETLRYAIFASEFVDRVHGNWNGSGVEVDRAWHW